MDENEIKAALLSGKDLRVPVEIPERNVTVQVRPLTNTEWNIISASQLRGLTMETSPANIKNGKVKIDLESMVMNNHASQVQTVKVAMVSPVMSAEEIGNMAPGHVAKIARKIFDISGLSEEALEKVASFQPDQRG